MNINFIKLSNIFLKFAVPSPAWIKNKQIIQRLEQIPEIIKDSKLVNFQENISINSDFCGAIEDEEQIIEFIVDELNNAKNNPNFKFPTPVSHLLNEYNDSLDSDKYADKNILLQQPSWKNLIVYNKIKINDSNIPSSPPKSKKERKIIDSNFIKGSSFLKELFASNPHNQNIQSTINKFLNSLSINRKYRQQKGTFTVTFSTNINDILGMSSRSKWKSCLSLDDDSNINYDSNYDKPEPCSKNVIDSYKAALIASVVNKNIGVIYLSSGSNFLDRGPEMNFRAQVWLVLNKNLRPSLFLQKIYPIDRDDIRKIFSSSLSKHTKLPVSSHLDYEDQFFINIDPSTPNILETPYSDSNNVFPTSSDDNTQIFLEEFLSIIKNAKQNLTNLQISSNKLDNFLSLLDNFIGSPDSILYKYYRTEFVNSISSLLQSNDFHDNFYLSAILKKINSMISSNVKFEL